MLSSSNTSGEKITITEVHHAWTDMGKKMFNVCYTREDGTKWVMRDWANDELDAYVKAMRKLEGAS
jgi:hypothetical protein